MNQQHAPSGVRGVEHLRPVEIAERQRMAAVARHVAVGNGRIGGPRDNRVDDIVRLAKDGLLATEYSSNVKPSVNSLARGSRRDTRRCQGWRSGSRLRALPAPPITIETNTSNAADTRRTSQVFTGKVSHGPAFQHHQRAHTPRRAVSPMLEIPCVPCVSVSSVLMEL